MKLQLVLAKIENAYPTDEADQSGWIPLLISPDTTSITDLPQEALDCSLSDLQRNITNLLEANILKWQGPETDHHQRFTAATVYHVLREFELDDKFLPQ